MKASVCALLLTVCFLGASSRPEFEKQTYEIFDESGQLCATYELAARFYPEYMRNNSQTPSTQEVNLPGVNYTEWNVKTDASRCPNLGVAELVVEFGDQNRFSLMTMSNDTLGSPSAAANSNWTVTLITLQYNKADPNVFPDTVDSGIVDVSVVNPGIGTEENQGGVFKCNSESQYKLASGDAEVQMELKDVLLNPYNDPDGDQNECEADTQSSSSDDKIVPIAVGCALAGLLLIVLVAFLIGKRSRRSGYKQV